MSNKVRNTSGKFAPKSEVPRKVRSVNLTDEAWQWLADVAARAGVSRNDYLEAMAGGNIPLMEAEGSDSVKTTEQLNSDVLPIMETVGHALTTPEEALADAAIYGFTPEEALADAHFRFNMLEANYDELEERYDAKKRELERADTLINLRNQEIAALNSRLAAKDETIAELGEQIDRLESELSDLKQNSASTSRDLPEAADLLNQFKAKRKKSTVTLADVEALLGMIEG